MNLVKNSNKIITKTQLNNDENTFQKGHIFSTYIFLVFWTREYAIYFLKIYR
jgi:hypothetical protein